MMVIMSPSDGMADSKWVWSDHSWSQLFTILVQDGKWRSRVHLKPWRFSSGWVREGCIVHTYDGQLDMAIVDDLVQLAAELQIYLNVKAVEVALTPIETAPLPNLGQWLNSVPTLGTCVR